MPEVRIDPLTGHQDDRRRRPRRAARRRPRARRRADPIDPEKDPFLEGHEDRTPPEIYAVRPDGGAPDTPGLDACASCPNLYPALDPDSRAAARRTPTPTCSPRAGAAARHEVSSTRPTRSPRSPTSTVEQVADAVDVWRAADARARRDGAPTCT